MPHEKRKFPEPDFEFRVKHEPWVGTYPNAPQQELQKKQSTKGSGAFIPDIPDDFGAGLAKLPELSEYRRDV